MLEHLIAMIFTSRLIMKFGDNRLIGLIALIELID